VFLLFSLKAQDLFVVWLDLAEVLPTQESSGHQKRSELRVLVDRLDEEVFVESVDHYVVLEHAFRYMLDVVLVLAASLQLEINLNVQHNLEVSIPGALFQGYDLLSQKLTFNLHKTINMSNSYVQEIQLIYLSSALNQKFSPFVKSSLHVRYKFDHQAFLCMEIIVEIAEEELEAVLNFW